ncbi:MAG: PhoH family protein [Pseudomonadota bacterium]
MSLQPPPSEGPSATLQLDGPHEALRAVCGELDQHLALIGRSLGVRLHRRGAEVRVEGVDGSVYLAERALRQLHELALARFPLHVTDISQACRLVQADAAVDIVALFSETVHVPGRKRNIFPRTPTQRAYVQAIRDCDLVFGVGPAGTGKTYLAMAMAVAALARDEVARIVLCRPAVEAGEKLGFLPGDMAEKVNPYLRPLYDALHDMVPHEKAARLMQRGVIEVAPLAFMRGRTLNEAFVILDEAQNTTSEQMKMALTRLGEDTQAVVTGDVTQIDLPQGQPSGLVEAVKLLGNIEGIQVVQFSRADVVRHPLVAAIIEAYDRRPSPPRRGKAHAAEAPSAHPDPTTSGPDTGERRDHGMEG